MGKYLYENPKLTLYKNDLTFKADSGIIIYIKLGETNGRGSSEGESLHGVLFAKINILIVLVENSVISNNWGNMNMKPIKSISVIVVVILLLLLQLGCEEQVAPRRQLNPDWFNQRAWQNPAISQSQPRPVMPAVKKAPTITFDKVIHNFGNVSPATTHICQFDFTNTGNDILEIIEIEQTCGCTPSVMMKTQYAPGEKGSLKVGFYSDTQLGRTSKPIYIYSNDEANPEVELAIQANIIAKIDYHPKKLDLMLMQQNANCPPITIRSIDNQPFSITSFKSSDGCITADFDSSQQATQFVLQPKVDMQKLERIMDGRFEIGLSHPETKTISGIFDAPPRFQTSPRAIMVHQARASQRVVKKVRVISNYNEQFDIESVFSKEGHINILNQKRTNNGYELDIEIKPPDSKGRTRIFSDTLSIGLKGIGRLNISCNGFYAGTSPQGSRKLTAKKGKCRSCKGPILTK